MKKEKKTKEKSFSKEEICTGILNILSGSPNMSFSDKQFAFRLGLQKKKDRKKLQSMLELLLEKGKITEPTPWKYQHIPQKQKFTNGTIEITRKGFGFVTAADFPDDIYIPVKKTLNSLTGDTVKVLLSNKLRGEGKIEGEVAEVIQRNKKTFVGVLEVSKNFAFLIPDNPKVQVDFFIPGSALNGAINGEKVVVELTEWPEDKKNPVGKVIRVLGKAGEHNVEMHAILEEFDLPYEFSQEVVKEADLIPDQISEEEIKKRKDFRKTLTFTIDPEDAKDFDDAISFKKINDASWEIGVHIADVTHYLIPGTILDKEGYRRATSVYLVDRTVPMLPERLSNFLCSLRPDEDKLCFSAVFNLDEKGNIQKEWFGKTIIRSNRRFTYEEVQEIIETKKGDFAKEILLTNKIATALREKRYANGAFSFETEEVKFRLDKDGTPLEVIKKIRKEAHMLIEEFMLLANKKVAELVSVKGDQKYPFVYRVHDSPDKLKLANFSTIARQLGYQIDLSNNRNLAISFNNLLKEIEGKPEQNFLESLAIRTMSKAKYTPDNSGHFGLAFDYYTHFTSPIRRYPDVMVHRLLEDFLKKRRDKNHQAQLAERCKHTSDKEVNAESAERASIKYKQVEFMTNHINQKFEGVISGVTEFGIYVELIENKCEGMVSLRSMDDDYYLFDEANYLVKGFKLGKIYKLGQVVVIRVTGANIIQRQLDFEMVS